MSAPQQPLFDAAAFGQRLTERLNANGQRACHVAALAGVSVATMSRALRGHPDLSHENFLRLERWLSAGQERKAA